MTRKLSRLLLVLLMSCLWASSSQAYIPPSYFILKSMASKHSGIKGARIRTNVRALEEGKPVEGVSFRTVSAYDPQRGVLRISAQGTENQVLYIAERSGPELTPAEQLLLQDDPATLAKALIAQGVPVKTEADLLALPDEEQRRAVEMTSLKRWQGTVAWVIGTPDGPQLWVEKASFLPLRLQTSSTEVRFESFHHYRGFPYPKTVRLGEPGSEPSLAEELIDINVGPVGADLKGDAVTGMTEAGKSAPAAVRRTLESYFKHLR